MRQGRKSYAEQTRVRLLDLWRGEKSFGTPVGCVATTYTFDAELFEEQCLARFLRIQGNPNEAARAYLLEREEKLSECFACVLVDEAHVAAHRSLQWSLLPVRVPAAGVQHAKLSLLVWQRHIRLIVSSANLTEPGYRRNVEMAAVFDFSPESTQPKGVLRQSLDFLTALRGLAPGSASSNPGPQARLTKFLNIVEAQARELPEGTDSEAHCELIPLVPGAEAMATSVLDRLRDLWKGAAPTEARVLSPFYDDGDLASETARALAGLLTNRGSRQIVFVGSGEMDAGKVCLNVPECLAKTTSHPSLEHYFDWVPNRSKIGDERVLRALHAKGLYLGRDDSALYMLGSSNFTQKGLGLSGGQNVELNVAYWLKDSTRPFGKKLGASWPSAEQIDDSGKVRFVGGGEQSEDDEGGPMPLPASFGLALYRGPITNARLELEIGEGAPGEFTVRAESGHSLLTADAWRSSGSQATVTVSWPERRPPSAITVNWRTSNGEYEAAWIVNVSDAADLPPAVDLQDLTLDELMEVLTSARPLHEMLGRVLDRRERSAPNGRAVEVDPHRKIDTSTFLLRRMKRFSHALEGLRERLQQPVAHIETVQFKLRGPVGPIALAKRLQEQEKDGAGFMIAELATTLESIRWTLFGGLKRAEVRAEVRCVIAELRSMAETSNASGTLAEYVRTAFEEITR